MSELAPVIQAVFQVDLIAAILLGPGHRQVNAGGLPLDREASLAYAAASLTDRRAGSKRPLPNFPRRL